MRPRASSVRTTESTLTARIDATWPRVTGCLYAITASVSSAACESRDGACELTNSETRSSCSAREPVVVLDEPFDRLPDGGHGGTDRRGEGDEALRILDDQQDRLEPAGDGGRGIRRLLTSPVLGGRAGNVIGHSRPPGSRDSRRTTGRRSSAG